ncbi:MAG: hypothetical protein II882_10110 [Lachnospiraceae bacterium]|nr:hypothetical protein [Lachnospiraceae bacterium]
MNKIFRKTAALMLAAALLFSTLSAQAGDNNRFRRDGDVLYDEAPSPVSPLANGDIIADHGALKVLEYDYISLINRLAASDAYKGLFPVSKIYVDGQEAAETLGLRVLISNSPNHRQSGNSGTTVSFINGSARSTGNAAYGIGQFLNNEQFTINGEIGYCFDWTTPAASGTHEPSPTLVDAGILVGTGADVEKLAAAAKMLTRDNYKLIRDNASSIARGLSIPAFTDPDYSYIESAGVEIPQELMVRLLQDTSADGIAFKRGLVQMLVWQQMNDISFSDWFYSFLTSAGYYNKEGQWIETPGSTPITTPIVGIGSLIDFPGLYSLGYRAWVELQGSAASTADAEWQYELTVGVPFTVPAADAEGIGKILDANGGKIDPDGEIAVQRSADGKTITLTAAAPTAGWTDWLGMTESSRMIYSSLPYNPSYFDAEGSYVAGSGQFIVDVSELLYLRARVKAELNDGYLTVMKTGGNSALTEGNTAYSLAGAVYGVYASRADAASDANRLGTLTTASDGSSGSLSLEVGTYYVKELTASPGYAKDTAIHSVDVSAENTADNPAVVQSVEPPLADPVGLILRKTDEKTGDEGRRVEQ